jgi:hypothetical protein
LRKKPVIPMACPSASAITDALNEESERMGGRLEASAAGLQPTRLVRQLSA